MRFVLPCCNACGKLHWYPRAICPYCFSSEIEYRPASGKGTIYSYSVMRRTSSPYVIAYVALEEGVTMMTNIVECDFDDIKIGQMVEVVFVPTNGPPVPMFRPTRTAQPS
jgi:hypothetical protein